MFTRPAASSPTEPTLNDNIRHFMVKYNDTQGTGYQQHRLLVIACCRSTQDDQDTDILLARTASPQSLSTPTTTWSLPEIDLSELPGNTGINDSIKKIVLDYCRKAFVDDRAQVKLLISTSAEPAYVSPSELLNWAGPTLRIFVVVAYPDRPQLRDSNSGGVLAFKSLSWLQQNADACDGGEEVVHIIASAATRADDDE